MLSTCSRSSSASSMTSRSNEVTLFLATVRES